MTERAAARRVSRVARLRGRPAGWAVWGLPPPAVGYLLGVEVAAVLAVLAAQRGAPVTAAGLLRGGYLAVLAVGAVEATRRVERRRERGAAPFRDLTTVWTYAAALLVPPAAAAGVVLAVYAMTWLRVRRFVPHRWVFSMSTCLLGAVAASTVYQHLAGADGRLSLPAAAAAALPAVVVNPLLVAVAVTVAVPGTRFRDAVGPPGDAVLELATLALGLLVAASYWTSPVAAVAAVPVVVALAHSLLVAQLQRAARTDPKTGLATSTAWHETATRELARAHRLREPVSVLLVDLDHFKRVNDTHGHLAGDAVLRAVAAALTAGVRDNDVVEAVGRWGGEEFVVLLPGADQNAAHVVADRLRRRIAALSIPHPDRLEQRIVVTASIGLAAYPTPAVDLADLLTRADAALYTAKNAGRDRVHTAAAT